MVKEDERELVMEGVVRMIVDDDKVVMESIFGEAHEVKGRIKEINIISQEALLVPLA